MGKIKKTEAKMRNFVKATGMLALSAHAEYMELNTIYEGK